LKSLEIFIYRELLNAQSVCELIREISKRAAGVPITLVLDNARYQKCLLVQNLAAE